MQSTLVLAVLVTLCALALLAHSLATRLVRESVRCTALRTGLPLDDATEPLVVRRFVARERWAGTGALLGGLTGLLLPGDDRSPLLGSAAGDLRGYAVLLGFFGGTALGLGALAWRETRHRTAGAGPRVARTSVPTVEDYVAPHERRGAWVLALVCAGVTLTAALRDGPGLPGPLVAVGTALPLVVVATVEALLHRLVSARQSAPTALALAWDDVLRARTARDLVTVPLTASAYLLLVTASRAEDAGSIPAGLTPALLVAFLVTACVSILLDPRGHVGRRLWPQPPAATPPAPSTLAAGPR